MIACYTAAALLSSIYIGSTPCLGNVGIQNIEQTDTHLGIEKTEQLIVYKSDALTAENATGLENFSVALEGKVNNSFSNFGIIINASNYYANVDNIGANAYIENQSSGIWFGDLVSNTGGASILNIGVWNGGASIYEGILTNAGVWNGNINSYALAIVDNQGTIVGDLNNSGNFWNNGTWIGAINNTNEFRNNSNSIVTGLVTNSATFSNSGTLSSGYFQTLGNGENRGTVKGDVNVVGGFFSTSGKVIGSVTNSASTLASGTITGAIVNKGSGIFVVSGDLAVNSTILNSDAGILRVVSGANLTGITSLSNQSGRLFDAMLVQGRISILNSLNNSAGSQLRIASGGKITSADILNSGRLFVDFGGQVSSSIANNGVISNSGIFRAEVNNLNKGAITNTINGVWSGNEISNTKNATIFNHGKWIGAAANGGNLYNANTGIWNGNLTNSLGAFAQNSGILNGAISNFGQILSIGTVGGGITNFAGGAVSISGTVSGDNVNAANWQLIGKLINDGGFFMNKPAGVLDVGANSFHGIGAFKNFDGGIIKIGTSSSNGMLGASTFTNAGIVEMSNQKIGDKIEVSGAYSGEAGSKISFDIDLAQSSNQADRLTVGSNFGTTEISLQNLSVSKKYFTNPIILVASGGGNGNFVASKDLQTTAALSSNSILDYKVLKLVDSDNWGIVSSINPRHATYISSGLATAVKSLSATFADINNNSFPSSAIKDKWTMHFWTQVAGSMHKSISKAKSDSLYNTPTETKDRVEFFSNKMGFDLGLAINNETQVSFGLNLGENKGTISSMETRFDIALPFMGLSAKVIIPNFDIAFDFVDFKLQGKPFSHFFEQELKGAGDLFSIRASRDFKVNSKDFALFANFTNAKYWTSQMTLSNDIGTLEIPDASNSSVTLGMRISAKYLVGTVTVLPFAQFRDINYLKSSVTSNFAPIENAPKVAFFAETGEISSRIDAGMSALFPNYGFEAFVNASAYFGNNCGGSEISIGGKIAF